MPGSPRAPPRNNFIPLIQRGRGIRPDEAPATLQSVLVTRTWRGSRLGKVPNPSHGEMRREEDEEKGPRLHGCADCRNLHEPHRRRRRPRPRHRAELPGVRPQGSARTGLRLRRVFRPPRDRLRLLGLRRRRAAQADRSRPREHLALRPLLPVPADVATKPNINPGWTKLVQADNLARELGVTGGLYVKDDSGNPTHSFKDRVVARPSRPPAPSASPPCPAPPPATSPVPSAPPPPGPASAPACSSRTTWSRARSSWPPSTAVSWSASRATTTT